MHVHNICVHDVTSLDFHSRWQELEQAKGQTERNVCLLEAMAGK